MQPGLINGGTEGDHTQITNFNSTEENQIRLLRKHKAYGYDLDIWWHDAGWYVRRDVPDWFPREDWPAYAADNIAWASWQWWRVGTWEVDPDRFPNGMLPVSREAERLGAKLLLWFEPERVYKGTRLWKEHPEWLLSCVCDEPRTVNSYLLDLGNDEARRWLTDFLCDFIQTHGVRIYRQDFNFPLLAYWIANEAEDRQGFLENRHVQGYLAFWDALLERNSGLSIDSCAAGGRRNDLETMRRSVPYLKSDYGYDIPWDKRAFHQTLYQWIPYFAGHAIAKRLEETEDYTWERPKNQFDSYAFHSAMCPALSLYMDINDASLDHDCGRKMVALWRRVAPFPEFGDFYPLTEYSKSPAARSVFQFETPETRGGIVHALCHEQCAQAPFAVFPAVTFPEDVYRFENPETGEGMELAGRALFEQGFPLASVPRSGAL